MGPSNEKTPGEGIASSAAPPAPGGSGSRSGGAIRLLTSKACIHRTAIFVVATLFGALIQANTNAVGPLTIVRGMEGDGGVSVGTVRNDDGWLVSEQPPPPARRVRPPSGVGEPVASSPSAGSSGEEKGKGGGEEADSSEQQHASTAPNPDTGTTTTTTTNPRNSSSASSPAPPDGAGADGENATRVERMKEQAEAFAEHWNQRWGGHFKFHEFDFGPYNGCHQWKNNTLGSALWVHSSNHLRLPPFHNQKSFVDASSQGFGGCFFVVIATRASIEPAVHEVPTKTFYDKVVDKQHPVEQVKKKLREIREFLGGYNVAWYIAERIGTGDDGTGYNKHWPTAFQDWWNSAEVFGRFVAKALDVPTTPYDVVVATRPDIWYFTGFDAAKVHEYASKKKEQMAFFLRQGGPIARDQWKNDSSDPDLAMTYISGYEDPGNQIFVHTREVVEKVCIDMWKPDHCGMCYGTCGPVQLSQNSWNNFVCGHELVRLFQSIARAGARTYYADSVGFGVMLLSSVGGDKTSLHPAVWYHHAQRGCKAGPDTKVCAVADLLTNAWPMYMDLDGTEGTNACRFGQWDRSKGPPTKVYKQTKHNDDVKLWGPGFVNAYYYLSTKLVNLSLTS